MRLKYGRSYLTLMTPSRLPHHSNGRCCAGMNTMWKQPGRSKRWTVDKRTHNSQQRGHMHTSQPHNRFGEEGEKETELGEREGREREGGEGGTAEQVGSCVCVIILILVIQHDPCRSPCTLPSHPFLPFLTPLLFRFSKLSSSHQHEHERTSQKNATHGKKRTPWTMKPEQVVGVLYGP